MSRLATFGRYSLARRVVRREAIFLVAAAALVLGGLGYAYFSRATTLTIGVAPNGGTEPALFRAFAAALEARDKDVRLKVVPFDGVRESAEALEAGKVDLAIARPDIALPDNGLMLAVLREQAVLVGAPEAAGIKALPDLARKRLAYGAARASDKELIVNLIEHAGLTVLVDTTGPVPPKSVALVATDEADLAKAFADKRVDALVMVTTPTTPAAQRLVGIVQGASRNRKVALVGVPDAAAITERNDKLHPVTVPAGFFGGNPKVPEEDVGTVGVSYRLMARANLSRSVAASLTQYLFEMRSSLSEAHPSAGTVRAPAYETTAGATSARLPIHPGAIDYFEREQESFIERYETWIYLVAFLGGGVGSVLAWLRQRLSRLRRERIEVATERLLEIRCEARRSTDPDKLTATAAEIDDLAANIARYALNRHTEARTMSAATIAIDAARSTIRRALEAQKPVRPTVKPGLRAVD